MFKNKKFFTVFLFETIMPWILAILGVIDTCLFNRIYRVHGSERANIEAIFDVFYKISMGYSVFLIAAFVIVGIVAFILMCIKIFAHEKGDKYAVLRPLIICAYGGLCIMGTVIILLLIGAMTYGQSV